VPVYDSDPEDVELLGWEEFVTRQWESIFAGYRSSAGLRATCRRWSDLLEAGLACSQEIADLLVRAEILGARLRALARRLAFGTGTADPDGTVSPAG
jgi:hypothetical protein